MLGSLTHKTEHEVHPLFDAKYVWFSIREEILEGASFVLTKKCEMSSIREVNQTNCDCLSN